ncbi:MAG: type II toxin-antitoxin system Phd/YefM family antitoxin [Acidimicrobiales bacterium]
MTRIGVRELRQHASRYLDKVKAGETVEVTERGELVAVLVPPPPHVAQRDQLIADGRLLPARSAFRLPTRVPFESSPTASEVLTDSRADQPR